MFGDIGTGELLVIFVLALLVFGPRKLPELGKSLGRAINEFKKASSDLRSRIEEEIETEKTAPPPPPAEDETKPSDAAQEQVG
jgi:TatA/E family protein of Tat protein translocase